MNRQRIHQHLTSTRFQLTTNQPQQGRLAGTATAHYRYDFSAWKSHVNSLKDRAAIVRKIDAREFDQVIGLHGKNRIEKLAHCNGDSGHSPCPENFGDYSVSWAFSRHWTRDRPLDTLPK